MAESSLDRLKRLAAEKKAAGNVAVATEVPAGTAPTQKEVSNAQSNSNIHDSSMDNSTSSRTVLLQDETAGAQESRETNSSSIGISSDTVSDNVVANTALVMAAAEEAIQAPAPKSITTSDHPLAMQFAELEQALNAKDPQFPTILRQIHRQLGQDAELVTQMSEEEIQLIVTGMVVYANAEIVEPAKVKAAKSAVAKAGKKPITADDL